MVRGADFAESEVCEEHVAEFVEENVLWLQVPVDDRVRVQVLQRQNDLSGVKLRPRLAEATGCTAEDTGQGEGREGRTR